MEKIFTPNRWFVLFCGLLILVWGALRIVADVRLCETAKLAGLRIFTWNWPELAVQSEVESLHAQVVRRGSHDAVVTVTARQLIHKSGDETNSKIVEKPSSEDVEATLTFYRSEDRWELGKVELR